ncbi:hypothetical protein [Scytonema sp. NUACC26]|uniref:hypothetical protein n=1 Tax=Scytonema sp. NUACC26 TaxID=3140176 RepID=UPI0034DC7281
MLFLRLEDLEIQGVSYKGASQIIFKNKILTRFIDLSTQYRQKALKVCQEFLDANLFCLIVENRSYLTVWVEEKEQKLAGETEIINYKLYEPASLSFPVADTETTVQTQKKPTTSVRSHNSSQNLFSNDEEKSANSNLVNEQGECDSLPLSQPSTEHKPSPKKSTRKYRGISY